MADTPADRLKQINERLKTKAAGAGVRTKGQSVIARMVAKQKPPYGRTGSQDGSRGVVTIQKAAAYAAGQLDESDPEVREAADLSNRIKAVYGPHYPFANVPRSLAVPASTGYLPTHTAQGHEIHGAKEVAKEVRERVLTVKGIDPDELEHIRRKGGDTAGLATKTLSTLSDLAGGSTVAPPSLGDLIDLQRTMEVFSRAGANNVTLPPNGRMAFPKLTGGSTAYWVGETASVTPSEQTTGSLTLEVKTLAVRVPLTLQLMRFSDTSIDAMVRVDMARIAALAADLAQLEGTGGTRIKGLITYTSAASWTQGTDKLLAYSVTANSFQPEDVAGIVATLPDEVEPTAWVMRRQMWARIKNRRADAVTAGDSKGAFVFNWERSVQDGGLSNVDTLDGTKVVWSSNVSATRGSGTQTYVLAGFFPDWLVGRLGVVEFMVDPYTAMQNLITNIQCVQFIDAGPRHSASFVFADAIDVA